MKKITPSCMLNLAMMVQLVLTRYKAILIEIDTADPDNAALLIAVRTLFPNIPVYVLITGRPVNLNASKETQKFDWNLQHSIAAQQDGAFRYARLLEDCGLNPVIFFDGGIACNAQVPHHRAMPDHWKFQDIQDHLRSRFYPQNFEVSELIKLLLGYGDGEIAVLIGGPLTGLGQLIRQAGNLQAFKVVKKFGSCHAQLGTFGTAKLMEFEPGVSRGLQTFNATLDPVSAYLYLESIVGICPTYLVSTDAAKDDRISFATTDELQAFLGDGRAARKICRQYAIWEENVLIPQKSRIFIYDFGVLISLLESMLDTRLVFNMLPVTIQKIYHLARTEEEVEKWGTMELVFSQVETGVWAAKDLVADTGYQLYHEALRQVFDPKAIDQKSLI